MNNSGYVIVKEKDTNPNSATYGYERTRVYIDTDLCPLGEQSSTSTHFWLRMSDVGMSDDILEAQLIGYTELDVLTMNNQIDFYVREGHTGYLEIVVGDYIESIAAWAFKNQTKIQSITLSSTVTNIKGDTQAYSPFVGCTGLSTLYCLSMSPPALPPNAFADAAQGFTIYVPASSVSAYRTATNWSTYASRIQPISS